MDEKLQEREKILEDTAKAAEPEVQTTSNLQKIIDAVKENKPIILQGPPGTGKSFILGKQIIPALQNENLLGKVKLVQFHQNYTYEDFIEGLQPTKDGSFQMQDGTFKVFCDQVEKEKLDGKVNIFVIDEINRADIAATFGEVLYLIEDREEREVSLAHSGRTFRIPNSVSIIGTMNTADRNIAILDFALRRRFQFIPIYPDYKILFNWYNLRYDKKTCPEPISYVRFAKELNRRILINPLLGKNLQIGHTFFMPKPSRSESDIVKFSEIVEQIQYNLLPQLEAYSSFGDQKQLAELLDHDVARKIQSSEEVTSEDVNGLITLLSECSTVKEWIP